MKRIGPSRFSADEGVVPGTGLKNEHIVPLSAGHQVIACAAVQDVVADAAVQLVVSAPSQKLIGGKRCERATLISV